MTNKIKYIYSHSLNEYIPAGFTKTKYYISNNGIDKMIKCKSIHYTWNDDDCVYYNDNVDDDYYMEIPRNGKKTFSLKLNYHARLKIKIDTI